MPSQEKTQNIGLNQWQGNEYVKRQDFVEDNLKIDEAVGVLDGQVENLTTGLDSQGQQLQQVSDGLVAHKADQTNPHGTTKADVGLGNVINAEQINAVAIYPADEDPNTTEKSYIVTNHSNKPLAGGSIYVHILTLFYSTKAGNRTQLALPYNNTNRMFFRRYFNNDWSDWTELMPVTGGTFTGHVSFARKWAIQPQLADYSEMAEVATGVMGARTINIANGNVFRHTLSGAVTYTFSNPAPSGQACSLTLIIQQPATPVAITFPASVKWPNDQIPPAPTGSKVAIYTFITTNGGTRWYGSQAMNEMVV